MLLTINLDVQYLCPMSYNRPLRIENARKCFLSKANEKHNNYYDYSKFIYRKAILESVIICPVHGEFNQTPHSHLIGRGCKLCGRSKVGKINSQTKESFIEKANKKFDKKYFYAEVEFINNITSVKIICQKHGAFWQQPSHHLQSTGCPRCIYDSVTGMYNLKNAEIHKNKWLDISAKFYFIECYNNNEVFQKIGITVKEKIKYRFGRLPYKYKVINTIETNLYEAVKKENELLKKYKKFKYIPLIKFKGFTECLKLTPQDAEHLRGLS